LSVSIERHSHVRRWTATVFVILFALAPSHTRSAASHRPDTVHLVAPVASACVSSPFGPRVLPNRPLAGTFHNGIDLPAPIGTAVTAVAPGTVIRVQRHGIGGLEILIQHDGFVGIYSHLGLIAPLLAEGRKAVYGGEKIATVGRTGLTYGPHLYFGMIFNGHFVDPAPFLQVGLCGAGAAATVPDGRIRPTRLFAQH
jgi:murein DD-endopeptidase MepM/ murein hydrolase activator NlpD